MECASKSGGISPSFALRVRIRFVALIIQASSFWKRLLTLPEIPPSTASNELLSCRHQIMLNTDKAQRSNKVWTQQKPILNKWRLNDRPFVWWWFNLGNKRTIWILSSKSQTHKTKTQIIWKLQTCKLNTQSQKFMKTVNFEGTFYLKTKHVHNEFPQFCKTRSSNPKK